MEKYFFTNLFDARIRLLQVVYQATESGDSLEEYGVHQRNEIFQEHLMPKLLA
jgi:hypothetical protein